MTRQTLHDLEHKQALKVIRKLLKDAMPVFKVPDMGVIQWLRATAKTLDKLEKSGADIIHMTLASEKGVVLPNIKKILVKHGKDKTAAKVSLMLLNTARRAILAGINNIIKIDDLGMAAMYFNDAADYVEISCMLYQGLRQKAFNKARSLDTASREELPISFWNLEGK